MATIKLETSQIGRMSVGIKTPIIRTGDNLQEIVIDSIFKAVGGFHDKAVIGITEAVVAIAQGNYATPEDIQASIAEKYPDASEIALMYPIQSRNRFMNVARAIAGMKQFKEIYIVLSYPCDEVGNRLVSEEKLYEVTANSSLDETYSEGEFYEIFGKPVHPFTGKDYIEEFKNACNGKATIVLCNNVCKAARVINCHDFLVCTIREDQRKLQKQMISDCIPDATVFDMSQILNKPINGSGYSPEYGLYGSNMMAAGRLKLMPRDCQEFVEDLQERILAYYGKKVEVMVYGDGAFKDPVGGIWELADPVTTLGATSGLSGTPKEVKLKYLASKYPDKSQEELAEIIAKEKAARMNTESVTGESSLGTTPRQKTDLFASWADLTTGSGDEQTPVVYSVGFLK